MKRQVVITGRGVLSILGDSPAGFHAALVRGRGLRDAGAEAAQDGGFAIERFEPKSYLGERNLRPLDRAGCLLACAAQLALADSGWSAKRLREEEVGLVAGTMFSTAHTIGEFDRFALREGPCYASPMTFANTVLNAPAGQTAIVHGLRGINSTIATGATSGLHALGHALDLIRAGRMRAVLAGGVEELSLESSCGFRRAGRLCERGRPLPFDSRSTGFLLGEGAAVLMLEDADTAAARGARVLAYLTGFGSRFDPFQGRVDERATAAAMGAMSLALRDAGADPADIDCISASARGDVLGDQREARALGEVFAKRGDDLAITSIKAQTGEALGAGGGMQVVALLEAMQQRTVSGIPGLGAIEDPFLAGKVCRASRSQEVRTALVNSVGFDGHCCAVVLTAPTARSLELVPKKRNSAERRRWLEDSSGATLEHVAASSLPDEDMRGNIENPVGAAQTPLGVAGPLLIHGEHARGTFYVPMATTEGALVLTYERGMAALTRAGGVTVRVCVDENVVSPAFLFEDVAAAVDFARKLPNDFAEIRTEAEATTRHGRLLRVETCPLGREVIVRFCYHTADAHGMNMIVKATERACQWITRRHSVRRFYIFSGHSSEKRASGTLFRGGKGKKVIAGARLPARVVRNYLHTTPAGMCDLWRHTMLGHASAHTVGYNGHFANGLTALFIACGQDVANVANAAVGVTVFEMEDKDLYASVTLPSLTVGTVGGGTGLGTGRECLASLGCAGAGKALKFAEVVAATLLAGELSMAAAIDSGELPQAHDTYGRNRPAEAK